VTGVGEVGGEVREGGSLSLLMLLMFCSPMVSRGVRVRG
jgi:hypothetical protein